jgi:hypothetical protein
VLADDVFVEFVDDFLRGHLRHFSSPKINHGAHEEHGAEFFKIFPRVPRAPRGDNDYSRTSIT